jgi:hypothetical protein
MTRPTDKNDRVPQKYHSSSGTPSRSVSGERGAQPLSPDVVPIRVTLAMEDGAPIVHAGVTLRPPRQPGARGGGGQHRIEWIDPDSGKRRQAGSTKLEDAWRRMLETADMLGEHRAGRSPQPVGGITVVDLVHSYLRPEVHAAWSESRQRTVKTLLTNWVAHERVTVRIHGRTVCAADLQVSELTPSLCEEMLNHVRLALAPRTYGDVHRELRTMLRWASREGLRPTEDDLPNRITLAKPTAPALFMKSPGQTIVPIDPDDIPSREAIDRLREVARRKLGESCVLRGRTHLEPGDKCLNVPAEDGRHRLAVELCEHRDLRFAPLVRCLKPK